MTNSEASTLVMLLILTATQGYLEEDGLQLESKPEMKLSSALNDVSEVMTCLGNDLQDSLRLLRQNSDNITDLRSHTDSIQYQLNNQETIIAETIRKEFAKLIENEELVRKNEVLKKELEDAHKKVQFQARRLEEVRVMGEQLTISKQLEEYEKSKDWAALRKGLEMLLDNKSTAYLQLQDLSHEENKPMWLMSRRGSAELVTLLVSGAPQISVKVRDGEQYGLLHGAAQGGHKHLVEMLLDHGADVEAAGGSDSMTPLMFAAMADSVPVASLLVQRGAAVQTTIPDGLTSLHCAAYYGQLGMARFLVEAGADTTAIAKDCCTPMDVAKRKGHTTLVQYLSQFPH